MILWRISAFPDLSGRGGLLAGGRWHNARKPVVYLTESPAAAMLEVLVHLEVDTEDIPNKLRLVRISFSDQVSIQSISEPSAHWEEYIEYTRSVGDAWLASGNTLLLDVPSATMPHTRNYLFNPLHHEAAHGVATVERLWLDRRLLKGR